LKEWVWRTPKIDASLEAGSLRDAKLPWKRLVISVRGRIMTRDPWGNGSALARRRRFSLADDLRFEAARKG